MDTGRDQRVCARITGTPGNAQGARRLAVIAGNPVPAGPAVSGVTGLCADSGAGTTGHLQVWYCGATSAQAWVVQPDGTVRDGTRCLTANGAGVTLARCGAASGQQWQVHPDGTVVDPVSGMCLADAGDSPVAGTALGLASCALTKGQLWHIE
jgi:Ricin-type beta-trefoil lectin domain